MVPEDLIELRGRCLLEPGEDVRVDVHRHDDAGVAHPLLDDLRVHALKQEQGRSASHVRRKEARVSFEGST